MHDGGGDDNAGTKLAHSHQHDVIGIKARKAACQNGREHSDGAGNQDHEEKANAQWDIVVSLRSCTASFDSAPISIHTMPAVVSHACAGCVWEDGHLLNPSMEMA